jgi:hypothetical protein
MAIKLSKVSIELSQVSIELFQVSIELSQMVIELSQVSIELSQASIKLSQAPAEPLYKKPVAPFPTYQRAFAAFRRRHERASAQAIHLTTRLFDPRASIVTIAPFMASRLQRPLCSSAHY